ncbi:NAD(+) diphosphatase [Aurantimonas endophytica]|uniref:NAD(+) diphosphatase n=1 Tax=Aurantimonas endophytica TaxID=1522175 RepID=A0A7W6MP91_9HYPH|nr:NAD(+) diphosphatase [Aurantimonas endophytica]MBB4002703.1 NAD+ diphosphatase [Aurantimonas endophytica]MCO6403582.1 NAD(+) diphosphatase [Aurantimonas endophytica]
MRDDDHRPESARAELSARTGFAGNWLSRDGEHRTDASLADALAHPAARLFLTSGEKWLLRTDAPSPVPLFSRAEAEALGAELAGCVLLGTDRAGEPHLAARLADGFAPADGMALIDLRSIAMQGLLDPDSEGQLGQAEHLLGWHARNRFCARCGAETHPEAAGYRRRCLACGDVVFPRTDPVTIMLVHDGEGRCVLGRQPRFPERFWSCLAGFVEAGETVEDAVRRETLEEAGLAVSRVDYLASQPWPFPGSLMIGCMALATPSPIVFDATELEECRWFGRDEVRAMLAGTHPEGLSVPQRFAIAHHLIKAFADG